MSVQIVMDSRGDTRHEFDSNDAASIARAEERYHRLIGHGFRAVALTKDGSPGTLLNKFDPAVEQTLFIPQLKGG
jgi:hypothetical protein